MDVRRTTLIVFAAAFAAALTATFFRFPPDWRLAGVESSKALGAPTIESWFSGDYAHNVDSWAVRRFGFRGFAIRLAHQLDWMVFHRMPKMRGTPIDVCPGNWLFEHEYVRNHVRRYQMKRADADEFAERLSSLRDSLAAKGIPLIVCITPSKAEVYPELLHDYMQPRGRYLRKTPARETMLAALQGQGLPVLDCTAELISWKANPPLLFARNGTHWNAYAAQRCFNLIMEMARADAPGLPEPPAVVGHEDRAPLLTDRDLSGLFNMMRYPYEDKTVPYPVLAKGEPSPRRIKVMAVGDSFSFQIADAMGRSGIVSDFKLLFYNKAEYRFHWKDGKRPVFNDSTKHRHGEIDPESYDYEKAIAECDLLIVEFNEIFAPCLEWGFPRPR